MIPLGHGLNVAVYVPYVEVSVATQVALVGYDWEGVDVSGDDFAYARHFDLCWARRQPFLNVEHDCVPWPGALEELMACPEPWCAFGYSLPCDRESDLTKSSLVPLGCMKIGDGLIVRSPDAWAEPLAWWYCDGHLTAVARSVGVEVHQHHPGVVNANRAYVQRFGFNASVDEYSFPSRILSRIKAVGPSRYLGAEVAS